LSEDEEDANYLYRKDEYVEEPTEQSVENTAVHEETPKPRTTEDGYEVPDFISDDDDDVIKID